MTHVFSKRIMGYFIRNEIIPDGEKELYIYGLQQGLVLLINLITMIFIGYALGMTWQVIIFSVAYLPLRSYAGGYHARTQRICYIFSIVLITTVLLVIKLISWTNTSSICVMVVASVIILFWHRWRIGISLWRKLKELYIESELASFYVLRYV